MALTLSCASFASSYGPLSTYSPASAYCASFSCSPFTSTANATATSTTTVTTIIPATLTVLNTSTAFTATTTTTLTDTTIAYRTTSTVFITVPQSTTTVTTNQTATATATVTAAKRKRDAAICTTKPASCSTYVSTEIVSRLVTKTANTSCTGSTVTYHSTIKGITTSLVAPGETTAPAYDVHSSNPAYSPVASSSSKIQAYMPDAATPARYAPTTAAPVYNAPSESNTSSTSCSTTRGVKPSSSVPSKQEKTKKSHSSSECTATSTESKSATATSGTVISKSALSMSGSVTSRAPLPTSVDALATLFSSLKADPSASAACACIESSLACTTALVTSTITDVATATANVTSPVTVTNNVTVQTTLTANTTTTRTLFTSTTTTVSVTPPPFTTTTTLTTTTTTTTTVTPAAATCSNLIRGYRRDTGNFLETRGGDYPSDTPEICAAFCRTRPRSVAFGWTASFKTCICYGTPTSGNVSVDDKSPILWGDIADCPTASNTTASSSAVSALPSTTTAIVTTTTTTASPPAATCSSLIRGYRLTTDDFLASRVDPSTGSTPEACAAFCRTVSSAVAFAQRTAFNFCACYSTSSNANTRTDDTSDTLLGDIINCPTSSNATASTSVVPSTSSVATTTATTTLAPAATCSNLVRGFRSGGGFLRQTGGSNSTTPEACATFCSTIAGAVAFAQSGNFSICNCYSTPTLNNLVRNETSTTLVGDIIDCPGRSTNLTSSSTIPVSTPVTTTTTATTATTSVAPAAATCSTLVQGYTNASRVKVGATDSLTAASSPENCAAFCKNLPRAIAFGQSTLINQCVCYDTPSQDNIRADPSGVFVFSDIANCYKS